MQQYRLEIRQAHGWEVLDTYNKYQKAFRGFMEFHGRRGDIDCRIAVNDCILVVGRARYGINAVPC